MTYTRVTQKQVDRAWADSVGAADMYERFTSQHNRENMINMTDRAEKLQQIFDEQGTKHMVLAYNGETLKIDPLFCDHRNALHFIEVDGDRWECPDCGATLDENWEVVRVTREIEF